MTPTYNARCVLLAVPIVVLAITSITFISAQDNQSSKNNEITSSNLKKNSQDSSKASPVISETGIIVAAIVGPATAIVSGATYSYQRKQYKLNSLIGVFNQLNTEEHRLAREKVYQAYNSYGKGSTENYINNLNSAAYKNHVELVKADFNEIGALVKNNLVEKKVFLDVYGSATLKYWDYLCKQIEKEGEERQDQFYMVNFKWIVNEARSRRLQNQVTAIQDARPSSFEE